MFSIFDHKERYEIFFDEKNAEKCLCINYENDPDYKIELINDNKELSTQDEYFYDIPYKIFSVILDGEIQAAFSKKFEAKEYADAYYESEKRRIIDNWGLDEDDLSSKRIGEIEMEIGDIKVKKYIPKDGEDYRDCVDILDKSLTDGDLDEDYFNTYF